MSESIVPTQLCNYAFHNTKQNEQIKTKQPEEETFSTVFTDSIPS